MNSETSRLSFTARNSALRDLDTLDFHTSGLFMETPPGGICDVGRDFYARIFRHLDALRPGEAVDCGVRAFWLERRPAWAFWRRRRIAHRKLVKVADLADRLARLAGEAHP